MTQMQTSKATTDWYIAEIVMEITVFGSVRNVVHRNMFLLSAANSDEAYRKAESIGKSLTTIPRASS